MAGNKYVSNNAGTLTEVAGNNTAATANEIVALDATGRINNAQMPVGIGADTQAVTTSEALAAGDFVNIFNSTGAKVRKADATVAGKEAHGFVLSAFLISTTATVYFEGTNTAVTGATAGVVYLSTSAGLSTSTAPTGTGNVAQRIGFATSATTINFQSQPPVVLA
jgi:hypothetical protein